MAANVVQHLALAVLVALPCALPGPAAAHAEATQLAVIYLDNDPASSALARYYAEQRGIAPSRLFAVNLGAPGDTVPADVFARARRKLLKRLPSEIQFLALAWTRPYRVDCASVTSAFAFGFTPELCARGCAPTRASPYFDSATQKPRDGYAILPAMLLGAASPESARQLVRRGIEAGRRTAPGAAYLVVTGDERRDRRTPAFRRVEQRFGERLPVHVVHAAGIRDRDDIDFYFTGSARVPHLDTLRFLPGAVADHLTSEGGFLSSNRQMNVLAWIDAGATASYGTVAEPCNFPQKFPDPEILIARVLGGETLIEAYWKSVRWPGQGLFVGEPLARPYARIASP